MEAVPLPLYQQDQGLNATTTSRKQQFIETLEYRRFVAFCDACRRERYIGLCFGVPGIGKTLSAVHYSRNELLSVRHPPAAADPDPLDTILYTTSVINTPSRIDIEVRRAREILLDRATRAIRTEARETLDKLRVRDEDWRSKHRNDPDYRSAQLPPFTPTYFHAFEAYEARKIAIPDPTALIIVDEAHRLTMPSLEQFRSIFDESRLALVLVGMPSLEKRAARYPQFFSRIGFVHEFRTLAPDEVQHLLLTQTQRVARINQMFHLTPAVVETARMNLVIGQA